MSSPSPLSTNHGLTLRQASLVAGIAYFLMPVAIAEFYIKPKLIIPGDIERTSQNIASHGQLFAAAILCYLVTYILDIVIAWALYVLLVPVNRSLSLLTAWFRLIYAALAILPLSNLLTVYRVLHSPVYLPVFGAGPLHAQVLLLLNSYNYGWGLFIFGIHLGLLGYLIYRSGYIPKLLGVLLVLDGFVWVVNSMQPYFYPNARLGFLFAVSFTELLLPLWLLVRGWRLNENDLRSSPSQKI
ncbi:MAG TPA: DUF4386 domain-containing protein [Candidatus Acidoferrales bacterium]|nr:DUF4386 domain-containing protein [Candidatus Acidoferrales bacterium]